MLHGRIPLLSRAVVMLFANLLSAFVTSRMYRFSYGRKKIIVRGILPIRAILQWAGILSDRCVDDETIQRARYLAGIKSGFKLDSVFRGWTETGWKRTLIFRSETNYISLLFCAMKYHKITVQYFVTILTDIV